MWRTAVCYLPADSDTPTDCVGKAEKSLVFFFLILLFPHSPVYPQDLRISNQLSLLGREVLINVLVPPKEDTPYLWSFAFLCSFSSSSIKFMKRRDGEGRTACGIQDVGTLLISCVLSCFLLLLRIHDISFVGGWLVVVFFLFVCFVTVDFYFFVKAGHLADKLTFSEKYFVWPAWPCSWRVGASSSPLMYE